VALAQPLQVNPCPRPFPRRATSINRSRSPRPASGHGLQASEEQRRGRVCEGRTCGAQRAGVFCVQMEAEGLALADGSAGRKLLKATKASKTSKAAKAALAAKAAAAKAKKCVVL